MSRKDFEILASWFYNHRPPESEEDAYFMWSTMLVDLATILQTTNPRFDEIKFMSAAGYMH